MLRAHNWQIPETTKQIAEASLPNGNRYLIFRDKLGVVYQDEAFAHLFVRLGQPAESPGLLAMITVMQYAEGLTDRQAAEAVGTRIDWKYALGLAITATPISHSVLSEFRQRLLSGSAEQLLLDEMLSRLQANGWLKARGQQRTDSTHVLGAIRQMNGLECIGETLRAALNQLADVAPDWLVQQVGDDWFELYGPRFENYRLPSQKNDRVELAQRIGQDGQHLLKAIDSPTAPVWLRALPRVQILRQVWIQQFYDDGHRLHWRTRKDHGLPPHQSLICSPYDPEVRYRTKRQQGWTGYTVHLTESCDPEQPHFITHCDTTPATTDDAQRLPVIHQALADKQLLPREHLVDTGYIEVDHLLNSQTDYQIELTGPVPPNTSWQAQNEQAYDLTCFTIDWDQQRVTCPRGQTNVGWHHRDTPVGPVIDVRFSRTACAACPDRHHCTRAKQGPRALTFYPKLKQQALHQARLRQLTDPFKERYKLRAGVEGAISQAVRCFGLRKARYIGQTKVHLQHVAIAAAINLTRIVAWLEEPTLAHTRVSSFQALDPGFT